MTESQRSTKKKRGLPKGGSPKKAARLKELKAIPRTILEPAEVEALYSVMAGTLANYRSAGTGPKFYRVGRKIIYKVEDIEAWLFGNPVQTVDSHRGRE